LKCGVVVYKQELRKIFTQQRGGGGRKDREWGGMHGERVNQSQKKNAGKFLSQWFFHQTRTGKESRPRLAQNYLQRKGERAKGNKAKGRNWGGTPRLEKEKFRKDQSCSMGSIKGKRGTVSRQSQKSSERGQRTDGGTPTANQGSYEVESGKTIPWLSGGRCGTRGKRGNLGD